MSVTVLSSSEYVFETLDRFETLQVTKVNTYGIVLHWQGSDESLRPVLMAAHQGTHEWS